MSASDVRRSSARLAGLRAYGHTPDPEVEADAYRQLAYHRILREIQIYRGNVPTLDPVHVGHLVALLVEGSDAEAVERFERAVRETADSLPTLTNEDRARVAATVLNSSAE